VKDGCPEDTVAIREIKREDVERFGSVRQFLEWKGRGEGRKDADTLTPGKHNKSEVHT